MPNIPNVPGVPALPSYSLGSIPLLVADVVTLIAQFFQPPWGIYLDGFPVVSADTVVSFDYKQDWVISDYPVEQGGFQSYDKVQLPFDVRVRYAAGGSEANRQALLDSVTFAANTLDLYDVLTPEATFSSCSITHFDFRRSASNGLGLLTIDVWLTEIRVTSTATFTNTLSPTAAGQQGVGNVQPQALPVPYAQNFSTGFWSIQ